MKIISIEIPDDEYVEFCEFMCEQRGYTDRVYGKDDPDPIPNPETKEDFTIRMLEENVVVGFVSWKEVKFAKAARLASHIKIKK
jgi:hypothetical protein